MSYFEFNISLKELAGSEHILRVGRHLRAAVKKNRVKQSDIAEFMGVDKSTVSKMLRGDANLTLRTVGELCEAIGVAPQFSCEPVEKKPRSNYEVHVTAGPSARALTLKAEPHLAQV